MAGTVTTLHCSKTPAFIWGPAFNRSFIGRIHGAIVPAIVAATGQSDRRLVYTLQATGRCDDRPVYTPYFLSHHYNVMICRHCDVQRRI